MQVLKWLNQRGYRELLTLCEGLQDQLDALKSQHASLRSRFYATRGPRTAPPDDRPSQPAVGSRAEKDAILRSYLFGGRHVEPKPAKPSPGEASQAPAHPAGGDAWDAGDAPAARAGSRGDPDVDDQAA